MNEQRSKGGKKFYRRRIAQGKLLIAKEAKNLVEIDFLCLRFIGFPVH